MLNQKPEEKQGGRRTFLGRLIGGFLSLWGLGAAGLGISFLRAPEADDRAGEGLIRCGPISSLPEGQARVVRHGSDPFIVVHAAAGEVLAFSAICTHLRCVLKWDESTRTIVCPCHAGVFDRGGNILSGPPTRPLTQRVAEVRAGEIVVRT